MSAQRQPAYERLTSISDGVAIPKRANEPADARDENAYLVAVNNIVPFAQCVMAASKKPTPENVLRSLSRTIRSRRRCNVWYRGQTIRDASLESSNRSHQHFNKVLDELFDVLTQHYIQYSHSRERIEVIKGIFDRNIEGKSPSYILELEERNSRGEDNQAIFEVVENPESKPVAENKFTKGKKPEPPADYQVEEPVPENKSTKGKKPEPPAFYQVEGSTDDIRFAIFNLFKDLDQIHHHVHGLLRKYQAGEVGLVLIRAVIKSAIGIVRNIETRFLRSLPQPRFSSWEDIMSIIVSPAQFQAISKGLSDNSELEFIHSIYGLTFQQLQQFRESLKAGAFPSYPIFPLLVPESRYLASRLRQTIILHEYLQEVALLGGGENLHLASEDDLTRAIIDVFEGARGSFTCKADTIHLWIVFGLEVFLDTQEHLGDCLCSTFFLPCLHLMQAQPRL